MAVQLARRLINIDEYHGMSKAGILTEKDRVELIHGEILETSPVGSNHVSVVIRLNKILNRLVEDSALINVQNPICIDDLNAPEPDISILKPRDDYYAEAHPSAHDILVVVEVADSTYDYDKQVKLPLYASAGIPEFWLVNLTRKEIELHKLPGKGAYKKIDIRYPEDHIDLAFCQKRVRVSDVIG